MSMFSETSGADRDDQNRASVSGHNGMVCASQPLASQAGIDILKAGGNAVEAAIAANAVLSVVEPMSCGPGGDLFAIVWIEKEQRLFGLNASGRSPFYWNIPTAESMGLDEIPLFGPLSWSVPGCVSGWEMLRKRFGRFSFDRLLEAAAAHARDGFEVTPIIARGWDRTDFKTYPTLAETFAPNGQAPKPGDLFRNLGMAHLYERLAVGGADEFYQGEFAERIIKHAKAHGGQMRQADFTEHTADWIEPVSSSYRGYDIWQLPPNGQGLAVLQIMNLLEQFDIASMEPNSAEQLHLFIEAKKLAFEDRAVYYADPDFAELPIEQLISKEYAKERLALIDRLRAATTVAPGRIKSGSNTIYLTAADSEGNMCSLIQSVYYPFGSQVVPDKLGFAMQNRGALFSLDPNHCNALMPHKRPFNTIIPGFVTKDNQPKFSFGVMGGDFQPQGQAQILMNIIDYGMSPMQAGAQARIAHAESSTPTGKTMVDGGTVIPEPSMPDATKRKLADMGHKVSNDEALFGGYQGIWRDDDPRQYRGGSDPRKDGCALGY